MTRPLMLAIALGAALMTIATVVYASHRHPAVAAPLYAEPEDGVPCPWATVNSYTP